MSMSRIITVGVAAAGCVGMLASAPVMAEDGFKMGNTTVTMGGFFKLDTIAVRTSDGSFIAEELRDAYVPGATPVGGRNSDESLTMHAKETRFSFRTDTDLGTGTPLKGLMEMDFGPGRAVLNGTSTTNNTGVIMRQAYFQYGSWSFGQTWSTGFFGPAILESLNFFSLSEGMFTPRQPLIRYTSGPLAISLERPTTIAQVSGSDTSLASLKSEFTNGLVPDVLARYSFKAGRAQLAVTGILRRLEVDGRVTNFGAPATPTVSETATGYGLGVAGDVPLGDATNFKFQVLAGKGVGRYTGLAFTPDVEVADDGSSMEAVKHVSFNTGIAHRFDAHWRTNVGVGMENADLDGEKLSKRSWSGLVNLLYSPAKPVTFGVEVKHGARELVNGTDGSQTRLQFTARYDFGS